MNPKSNGLLKIDLTPQRTSSYLSGKCGKISFHTSSWEEDTPTKSNKSEDSTLKLYFNNFPLKLLKDFKLSSAECFDISLPNTPEYLVYSQINNEKNEKEILHITLEKLIEFMTTSFEKSSECFYLCLYGYLSFTDEETLFIELVKRFHILIPINITKSEEKYIYKQKILKIQRQIITFLQFWIEIYKDTIVLDKKLDALFEETLFLLYSYHEEYPDLNSELSKLLINLEEVRVYKNFKKLNETNFNSFKNCITSCLKEIVSPINNFIINHPKILAEQICLFDFDNFYRISIPELLKKKNFGGENYLFFAKNFNNFSKIISFLLLWQKNTHKRLVFFERIIDLIDRLLALKNYNTAFACYLSITHTSVERLHNSLLKKAGTKEKTKFKSFAALFDTSNNHHQLRHAQKKMLPPCIPFLGLYVKDLLNLEENAKLNKSEKKKNMIDFHKCSKISLIIKDIDSFKEIWYEFPKNEVIYEHFKYLPEVPEDILYELSYNILPSS